uniref:Uncharacterized protein n=1 Tax=Fervidicoccus fontis TaxID=683846 RepID=A0A7J3ZJ24_9CREN
MATKNFVMCKHYIDGEGPAVECTLDRKKFSRTSEKKISNGEPIIGVGAGIGVIAKMAEKAGTHLIIPKHHSDKNYNFSVLQYVSRAR